MGLLSAKREGYYVVYSIEPEKLATLSDELGHLVGRDQLLNQRTSLLCASRSTTTCVIGTAKRARAVFDDPTLEPV